MFFIKRAYVLFLVLILGSSLARAQTLDLPPRPAGALGGEAFALSIRDLPFDQREARIVEEILKGNVPSGSRRLVPIQVDRPGSATPLIFQATADYLAVGSDDDAFLVPLSPASAQTVADRLDCNLPTPMMVSLIYEAATTKLTPLPIPPSPAMTTVDVFLEHNRMVARQRVQNRATAVVAGHKKDVVISKKAFVSPGKVAIFGWHRGVGQPIQPVYSGHSASWVDYSHGIRLVSRRVLVDGQPRPLQEILADSALAPCLSDEGVLSQTRYPTHAMLPQSAEVLKLDHGVRVVIDRPKVNQDRPLETLLIFFALPNGGTIEQAFGKTLEVGDDWRFNIQHVGAQTRFLREQMPGRAVVVAYLENDLKSWPAWRKANGHKALQPILDAVKSRFDPARTRIALTGHSGGGSLIFGYLNTVESIPDEVERVAFLDANYAYETDAHRDKLINWLSASDRHVLSILAYNDAVALLNGKTFVSEEGGTWGRSRLMKHDLEARFPMTESTSGNLKHVNGLSGRISFWLLENPERAIYHTVQVERNGFIESILSGTPLQTKGYTYMGERAYGRFVTLGGTP